MVGEGRPKKHEQKFILHSLNFLDTTSYKKHPGSINHQLTRGMLWIKIKGWRGKEPNRSVLCPIWANLFKKSFHALLFPQLGSVPPPPPHTTSCPVSRCEAGNAQSARSVSLTQAPAGVTSRSCAFWTSHRCPVKPDLQQENSNLVL